MNEDFQDLVKTLLSRGRESTMLQLQNADSDFADAIEALDESETMLNYIANVLDEGPRLAIKNYQEAVENYYITYCDLTYIAGLTDMVSFLKSYDFLKDSSPNENENPAAPDPSTPVETID